MSKMKRFFVDFHVLQTVPPSCINRDDTGSPKTAVYGGTVRARVSSQAWKHAIRQMFMELLDESMLGQRTKRIVGMVAEKLDCEDAEKNAVEALTLAGLKIKNAEKGTDALFFMSDAQAKAIAELVTNGEKDKKKYQQVLKEHPSVDMALFGRMVADDPSLNFDASAQVAHSISTHAVHNEYDYFTAVDDRSPEDNAGAGHIGTVEFNSSTLYRYATVNVCELADTLNATPDTAATVVRAFAEAFVRSMPTGKQNTFANRTYPAMIYISVREDQPVNLVGAFETPVRSDNGFETASEKAFVDYAEDTYRLFAPNPVLSFGVSRRNDLARLTELSPFEDLLDKLESTVAKALNDRG